MKATPQYPRDSRVYPGLAGYATVGVSSLTIPQRGFYITMLEMCSCISLTGVIVQKLVD